MKIISCVLIYDVVCLSYELDSLYEAGLSIGENFGKNLISELKHNQFEVQNLSYYERERIAEMFEEYTDIYVNCVRIKSYKENKNYIDSVYRSLDTFDVKNYKIRVRVLEDDKLKISDYYCVFEDDSFRFYDKGPSLSELTPKCSSFWEILSKYTKETMEGLELNKQRLAKRREIIDYLRDVGIYIDIYPND